MSLNKDGTLPSSTFSAQQRHISQLYIPASVLSQFTSPVIKSTRPVQPTIDIITSIIGDFGIWQLRTVLIIFLCKISEAWFIACIIFTAPQLYPHSEFECDATNLNGNQTISPDQCFIVDEKNGTAECTNFVYNFDFHSLVMDFDLVCWRDIFIAWSQFWHLFGVFVGSAIATKMMVFISPRNTYFIGQMSQIVCGLATGFARNFSLHCAFRCLSAACCAIMTISGQTIFADIIEGNYLVGAIIFYETFWSIGLMYLPTLSTFCSSWTLIYLAITFPTLILMLLLNWTPDSPRWLLKNGNPNDIYQVEEIIRVAAKINDRTFKIPSNFRGELEKLREQLKSSAPPARWTDLWKGSRAKRNMIAAPIALSCCLINFNRKIINIRLVERDLIAFNTFALGFVKLVGCFLSIHFVLNLNKWKWQLTGALNILAGVLGYFVGVIGKTELVHPPIIEMLRKITATIQILPLSCAQSMLAACLTELVPRNKQMPYIFSVGTWARLCLLTGPFFDFQRNKNAALRVNSSFLMSILLGICTALLLKPNNI